MMVHQTSILDANPKKQTQRLSNFTTMLWSNLYVVDQFGSLKFRRKCARWKKPPEMLQFEKMIVLRVTMPQSLLFLCLHVVVCSKLEKVASKLVRNTIQI